MKKLSTILCTLALLFIGVGGVNSVKADNGKTPLMLTGGHSGDYTFDQEVANVVVTPLGTSTLDNLYSATFTVKNAQTNIFQYKGLDVSDYEKIVIKFAEPVQGNWAYSYRNEYPPTIPVGSTFLVIDITSIPTIGDFTIFNWDGVPDGVSISIEEMYLWKTENELVHTKDWSDASSYDMWNSKPSGATIGINSTDKVLEIINPSVVDNWACQYFVANGFSTVADEDYVVSITLKSSVAGDITCSLGNWDYSTTQNFSVTANELATKQVTFKTFPLSTTNGTRVMLQSGALAGTIQIEKVEVYRVPELGLITKPTRTATDAKTDVFAAAEFKTIDGDATWDPDSRIFTKKCGWQWAGSGIDLSQYHYLVITAGKNWNYDPSCEVSIMDNNGKTISGDDHGTSFMNMHFSVWNNHNCLRIDLEKLRKEHSFDIYHVKELTINGQDGFILGNVYASNQKPNNDKNWGNEDNGDYKVADRSANRFGTICLPYQAAVAGAYVYEITGKTDNSITLTQYNDLLVAGKPYFFKSNAGKSGAETNNVYFYKATAATVASPVANNGLIGTFVNTTAPQGENYLVLSNNQLWEVDSEVTVGANKAYVDLSQITNASSRGTITLNLNDVTGISTVATQKGDDTFYNLSGQRVSQPRKGLYILNGKKIFVR